MKRRAARQSGKWCGELAAGRTVRREASGALRAKLRSGTGHAPLPRRHTSPSPPSPSPAAAPVRARRQGKKPNAPRRFWRRGGSPHDLWGQSSSLWAAGSRKRRLPHGLGGARQLSSGFLWAAGSRKRRRGARGGKRGQNAPSFPHSGKNMPQNIAIFAPVCYTEHTTQFHR